MHCLGQPTQSGSMQSCSALCVERLVWEIYFISLLLHCHFVSNAMQLCRVFRNRAIQQQCRRRWMCSEQQPRKKGDAAEEIPTIVPEPYTVPPGYVPPSLSELFRCVAKQMG